jgi:hypothetical protein
MTTPISIQVQTILDNNVVGDLKQAISKRKCLNTSNMVFIYIFHVVQTAGILITTVGAGYSDKNLVWVGAGLNALATLIHVYENINNGMSKRLLSDIKSIKAGTYIDEGELVEAEASKVNSVAEPQKQNGSGNVSVNGGAPEISQEV